MRIPVIAGKELELHTVGNAEPNCGDGDAAEKASELPKLGKRTISLAQMQH